MIGWGRWIGGRNAARSVAETTGVQDDLFGGPDRERVQIFVFVQKARDKFGTTPLEKDKITFTINTTLERNLNKKQFI